MPTDEIRVKGKGYFSDSGTFGGKEVVMRLDFQSQGKGKMIVRLLDAKGYGDMSAAKPGDDKSAPSESGIYLTVPEVKKIASWLGEWLEEEE